MSHFLQAQTSSEGIWQFSMLGCAGGVLLGLAGIAWQEQNAFDQIATWQPLKEQAQMMLNQTVLTTRGVVSTRESHTDLSHRLQFLSDRERQHHNWHEVQSGLMQARLYAASLKLQLLEWQQGHLVLEGQVTSSQDLAVLHQRLLRFEHWQDAPNVPQIQWVAPKVQAVPHDTADVGSQVIPLYAFRMQAQLKSAQKTVSAKEEGR